MLEPPFELGQRYARAVGGDDGVAAIGGFEHGKAGAFDVGVFRHAFDRQIRRSVRHVPTTVTPAGTSFVACGWRLSTVVVNPAAAKLCAMPRPIAP